MEIEASEPEQHEQQEVEDKSKKSKPDKQQEGQQGLQIFVKVEERTYTLDVVESDAIAMLKAMIQGMATTDHCDHRT